MNRRKFIKAGALNGLFLTRSQGMMGLSSCSSSPTKKETVKDKIWLWKQNVGSHYLPENPWLIPLGNEMESKENCNFLEIDRCYGVVMGEHDSFPPFNEEAKN